MTMDVTMETLNTIKAATDPRLKEIREAMDAFGDEALDAWDVAIGYVLGVALNRTSSDAEQRANTLATINTMIAPLHCRIEEE